MGVLHDSPRRHPGCFLAIAIFSAGIGLAPAQESRLAMRPIRLVVGAGAGGGTDIAARIVAQSLSDMLGQPVVVENRPGAAAPRRPTRSRSREGRLHRPDDEQFARDFGRDVQDAALRSARRLPDGVAGRHGRPGAGDGAGLPGRTSRACSAARANPGKLNFGSAGIGTTQQFAGELMKQTASLAITHIPYRTTRRRR